MILLLVPIKIKENFKPYVCKQFKQFRKEISISKKKILLFQLKQKLDKAKLFGATENQIQITKYKNESLF